MSIVDLDARNSALNANASYIVQAPAGSGKTGLLVHRFLVLLAGVRKPENVLAITFTRKAAQEMRQRIVELLQLAEAGTNGHDAFQNQGIELARQALQHSRERGWDLLLAPQALQVYTIDAFCGRLVSDMPWLSRLGGSPTTLDNADEHYQAAVEELLQELLEPDSGIHASLLLVMQALGFNYISARDMFTTILGRRDQWLRHIIGRQDDNWLKQLNAAWQSVVQSHLQKLIDCLSPSILGDLRETGLRASGFASDKHKELYQAFLDWSAGEMPGMVQWSAIRQLLLTQKGTARNASSFNTPLGFPPEEKANKKKILDIQQQLLERTNSIELLQQTAELPAVDLQPADARLLAALRQVLLTLAGLLQLRFRRFGVSDHCEISQRANAALAEQAQPTEQALRLDNQLQHILVDEFQDTSRSQFQLLHNLTAGWTNGDGKTLFLVGDPMQSIYRFREAEVGLFMQVMDNATSGLLPNVEINALQLRQNFRSSSKLVDWFNEHLARVFAREENVQQGAVSYCASHSVKTDNACIDVQFAADDVSEAEHLAASLKQIVRDNPEQKIAILVRSRAHLVHILPALDRAGLAFSGDGLESLSALPAVQDLIALARALDNPHDRIAWLSLLRGPWCGLRLQDIHHLVAQVDKSVWQQLVHADTSDLSDTAGKRLKRFIATMQVAMQQRQLTALPELVAWTWRALGGLHSLGRASEEHMETALQLLETAFAEMQENPLTIFQQACEKEKIDSQTQSNIIVSTIHNAKGLEYDVVCLPALHRRPRPQDKAVLMWSEVETGNAQNDLLLAPYSLTDEAKQYTWLRDLEKKRANHELGRLIYVACTRAQRQLLLSAVIKDKDGQPTRPAQSSVLAHLWSSLQPIAEQQLSNLAAATVVDSNATQQTLWRIPADTEIPVGEDSDWRMHAPFSMPRFDSKDSELEYQWASSLAPAVGTILHQWLRFAGAAELKHSTQDLSSYWHYQLTQLDVPPERIEAGVERLNRALRNIKEDQQAAFIFADYAEQRNEMDISVVEDGQIRRYRIDRTFVDEHDQRWIIDYKTTDTKRTDLDDFVNEQVANRHRAQLQRYAQIMAAIDVRSIRLAVYFPLLSKLVQWPYQAGIANTD